MLRNSIQLKIESMTKKQNQEEKEVITNPQSPIPNPQSPIPIICI